MTGAALVYLFLAILGGVATKIIHRYVLREIDAYPYALLQNAVGALMFLPLVFSEFTVSGIPSLGWVVFGFAGVLWAALSLSSLTSYKKTDLGLREIVGQSCVFWALLLGVVLLSEPLTASKTIGTTLVFIGLALAIWHPEKRWGRVTDPGVLWTLFSAFLSAAVAVLDKYALSFFAVGFYGFAMYLIPTAVYSFFLRGRRESVRQAFVLKWKGMIAGSVIAALTYYAILKLFTLVEVTLVYPFLQLTTLLTVLGAIVILKEQEHVGQRLIAALLAVVGLIILK